MRKVYVNSPARALPTGRWRRSLNDHIDTATAAGQMLYAALDAVAPFECDALPERTVAELAAAKHRRECLRRPSAQIREVGRDAQARR